MKLLEALKNVQFDKAWGIWAELIDNEFNVDSEARYGQMIFDNGGVLDGYVFVCDGEYPAYQNMMWTRGDQLEKSDPRYMDEEFISNILEYLNDHRS